MDESLKTLRLTHKTFVGTCAVLITLSALSRPPQDANEAAKALQAILNEYAKISVPTQDVNFEEKVPGIASIIDAQLSVEFANWIPQTMRPDTSASVLQRLFIARVRQQIIKSGVFFYTPLDSSPDPDRPWVHAFAIELPCWEALAIQCTALFKAHLWNEIVFPSDGFEGRGSWGIEQISNQLDGVLLRLRELHEMSCDSVNDSTIQDIACYAEEQMTELTPWALTLEEFRPGCTYDTDVPALGHELKIAIESHSEHVYSISGIVFRKADTSVAAPLLMILVLSFFHLHVSHLRRLLADDSDATKRLSLYPWIAVMDGRLPRLLAACSFALLPAVVCWFFRPYFDSPRGGAVFAGFGITVILGLSAWWRLDTLRSKADAWRKTDAHRRNKGSSACRTLG